jgi:hypothetical protein
MQEYIKDNMITTSVSIRRRSVNNMLLVMILTAVGAQSVYISFVEYLAKLMEDIASRVDYSTFCTMYYSSNNITQYYIPIDLIVLELFIISAAIYYNSNVLANNGISRTFSILLIIAIYVLSFLVLFYVFEMLPFNVSAIKELHANDGGFAGVASTHDYFRVGRIGWTIPLIAGMVFIVMAYIASRIKRE